MNLSILYNDLGRYGEAKKLIKVSPENAKASRSVLDPFIRSKLANKHAEVADWYAGVGAFDEAVAEYRQALKLEETYADLRTSLAVCLREKGDLKGALEELLKATKTSPQYVDAHIQLGLTHYTLGKKAEAVKVWKSAVKKFPANETVKMYLALAK